MKRIIVPPDPPTTKMSKRVRIDQITRMTARIQSRVLIMAHLLVYAVYAFQRAYALILLHFLQKEKPCQLVKTDRARNVDVIVT